MFLKTFENFLKPSFSRELQNQIMYTNDYHWNWVSSTANNLQEPDDWDFSWVHFIFQDNNILSNLYPHFMPIVLDIADGCGLTVDFITRIRLGCLTRTPYTVIHKPHIDFGDPHFTALFYVNDSDGDTVIYNERFPYGDTDIDHVKFSENIKFTENTRSTPSFNKILVFDGSYYHSSSSPILNDRRLVVTMNFVVK
jgi:hypothetical protein